MNADWFKIIFDKLNAYSAYNCLKLSSSLFNATIFMVGRADPSSILFSSKCIFCKIVLGNLPSHIIIEDKKAVAFLDAFPLAKGHTLVIPKIHFSKIQDMSEDHGSAVFTLCIE